MTPLVQPPGLFKESLQEPQVLGNQRPIDDQQKPFTSGLLPTTFYNKFSDQTTGDVIATTIALKKGQSLQDRAGLSYRTLNNPAWQKTRQCPQDVHSHIVRRGEVPCRTLTNREPLADLLRSAKLWNVLWRSRGRHAINEACGRQKSDWRHGC